MSSALRKKHQNLEKNVKIPEKTGEFAIRPLPDGARHRPDGARPV
jgi:hypothetical protein